MSFVGDSSNLSSKSSEECILFLNDSISLCESSKNYDLTRNEPVTRLKSGFMYLSWTVIKNMDDILTFDWTTNQIADLSDNRYGYTEKDTGLIWELTNDTVTIQGLNCQKAIVNFGNRKWIAWFTNEIPISDGPYKFKGLPGLIVDIEDERGHWKFELVGIEKNNFQIPVFSLSDIEWINKFDFFELKKYVNNNYLTLKEATGKFTLDNENRAIFKKRIEANIKAISNWIELYP